MANKLIKLDGNEESTVSNVVDGDTLDTDSGKRVRVGYIDAPESVHKNARLNTQSGESSAEFAKDILPEGSKVVTHDYGQDHFNRSVAGVNRVINGVEVDFGLVSLDQQAASYYTKYGEHPDPLKHDQYKEYYSKHVPYQFGSAEKQLTKDEFNSIATKQAAFSTTYDNFKNGEATQDDLDNVTADLYGNPELVMRYRHQLSNWNRPLENESDTTIRGIMRNAMEDPVIRDLYNRAVRNGGLQMDQVPEREPSFWSNFKAFTQQMGGIPGLIDTAELWNAQRYGSDYGVSDEELTKGVPEQYHTMILAEAAEHNDHSGLVMRDQLIDDIKNNDQIDKLPLHAQLAYGAATLLLDPLVLIPAGPIIKGGQAINIAAKSLGFGAKRRAAVGLGVWGVGGALEGVPINTVPLGGDHTYTAQDFYMNTLLDGTIGLGLGTVVDYALRPTLGKYMGNVRATREKDKVAVQQYEVKQSTPVQPVDIPSNDVAPTPDAVTVKVSDTVEDVTETIYSPPSPVAKANNDKAKSSMRQANVQQNISYLTNQPFTPWEAISEVSPGNYRAAINTVKGNFPEQTPLRYLMNSQLGLNGKQLTPELRGLADQLSSDVLHVVAAFPDGNVPPNVEKAIKGITFTQKTTTKRHAISDLLQGDISNPTETLHGYVATLRNHKELWEGYDPIPVSRSDFYKNQDYLLREGGDNLNPELNTILPKDISFLKDVLHLNKMIDEVNDPTFTELVEELNGYVTTRMEQRESGDFRQYTDSSKVHAPTVQMLAPEIVTQLKAEGLQPGSNKWKARREQLQKTGKQVVSQEVRDIGRVDEFNVGSRVDEYNPNVEEYHTTTELRSELDDLEGLDYLDKSELQTLKTMDPQQLGYAELKARNDATEGTADRIAAIEQQLLKNEEPSTSSLIGDTSEQDLLPRSFNVTKSESAYKDPNNITLANLHTKLQSLLKKLDVVNIKGKKDSTTKRSELARLTKGLMKHKDVTLKQMVDTGVWSNVEDILRASQAVSDNVLATQVVTKTNVSPSKDAAKEVAEDTTLTKPLNEQELGVLQDENSGVLEPKVSEQEYKDIKVRAAEAYKQLVDDVNTSILDSEEEFIRTGEKAAFGIARKPKGIIDYVGTLAVKLTEDLGTKFQNSKLTSLEYFGSRVTEIGKGYGGDIRRNATGGIIRHATYLDSMMQLAPNYDKAINAYVAAQGKGALSQFNAAWKAGADNKYVNAFNKDMFLIQEYRRQGKPLPKNLDKSILEFADSWNAFMASNHDKLVKAGIGGFTAARKIRHYIPHVWKPTSLKGAIRDHGIEKVEELFTRAYKASSNRGMNPISENKARELAKRQIEWINKTANSDTDQYIPAVDSRSQSRLELDTTTEVDGLSVLDLLDTEVISLGTKYANRVAGWIGLSKSTDGLLTSQLSIDAFKKRMVQEGGDQAIDTKKYEQWYDDVINQMFGRPTRGGLAPELMALKDLTALTRMGGLGTAQLIETAQVITRSVVSTFSDPAVARKIIAMGNETDSEAGLISEIMSISNITKDFEYLDRQSVHLDRAEIKEQHAARQLSLWIADKATGGSAKAPASRLLGKTTAYNVIRRYQSRITQASLAVDVAKHFKSGTGVMGNARMADLGLTDVNGVDKELSDVFNNIVEFGDDGMLKSLHIEDWPAAALEKFQYALVRDESQQIQRTQIGELPPWMNRPLMALAFQFREMPIVAANKQLARSIAFADKEAVTAIMLNSAMAGLVRYSKFTALGLGVAAITGNEISDPTESQMSIDKYITQLGLFPDMKDLVMDTYDAVGDKDFDKLNSKDLDRLTGQVPVLGLMQDYRDLATGDSNEQVDAAFGLLPLGNTAYGDMMHTAIQEMLGKDK